MQKFTETRVGFAEVPEEISLCINISNCPCHCEGCHSSHLAEDIGTELTEEVLSQLIEGNAGISCVAFMGGDSNPDDIHHLAMYVREMYPNLKIAWYSGRSELSSRAALNLHDYDYIKLGPYMPDKGPLDCITTNQRFYQVLNDDLVDITHKFWKHEVKD